MESLIDRFLVFLREAVEIDETCRKRTNQRIYICTYATMLYEHSESILFPFLTDGAIFVVDEDEFSAFGEPGWVEAGFLRPGGSPFDVEGGGAVDDARLFPVLAGMQIVDGVEAVRRLRSISHQRQRRGRVSGPLQRRRAADQENVADF